MSKKQSSRKVARTPKDSGKSGISPVIIVVVVVAALLVVGGLVLLGNQSSSSGSTDALDLSGYPTMGNEAAKVTMVEYSDYG